jgi:large subunit ribosomal protein L9
MKVVFLQDMPHKGKKGEIKEVADGFARNYLIPHNIAAIADNSIIKNIQTETNADASRKSKEHEELVALADKVNGQELVFTAKIGSKDRIHGSITSGNIAEKLSAQVGSEIDKKKIVLDEPLRQLGAHEVAVNLVKQKKTKVSVVIQEEKA